LLLKAMETHSEVFMTRALNVLTLALFFAVAGLAGSAPGQEKKLEKIRIGGGSVGAPQMTMWFAKEANLYAKHGLAIEAISIPGSSMAIQAMLSGEVPIIQLGGTARCRPI
jgi:ABC-type nitrate/sulfonate/bicarbonate transport system substrate-binding protein